MTGSGNLTGPLSGGTIVNSGLLTGPGYGIELAASTALTNAGRIQGNAGSGVDLYHGGTLTNAGGTITGVTGIRGRYGASVVDTSGTITGTGGTAIQLNAFQANRVVARPGAVFNGTVNGGNTGSYLTLSTLELGTGAGTGAIGGLGTSFTNFGHVEIDAGASWSLGGGNTLAANATLSNKGTLTGSFRLAGGSVVNTGLIAGASYGLQLSNPAALINAGTIRGNGNSGVDLYHGGVLTNAAGATVSGSIGARGRYGATTIDNSGTVTGSGGTAVRLNLFQTNRVIDRPGAVFNGLVDGGNSGAYLGLSTLELASAASQGTLSSLGTNYVSFGNVIVDAGARWALTGANTLGAGVNVTNGGTLSVVNASVAIAGGLVNNGQIVIDPSTMTVASLSGTGTVTIGSASTLDVTGSISASETIVFSDGTSVLQLGDPAHAAGTIAGFVTGDTIDLTGIAHNAADHADLLSGNTLQVIASGQTFDLGLLPSNNFTGNYFHLASDGGNGSANR